ncbi:MAG: hypothetical protein ABIH11_03360 [Candidatus Altiarchaeota archaeon]
MPRKKVKDNLDMGFTKLGFLLAILVIVAYGSPTKKVLNSINYVMWGGVSVSSLPLIEGAYNSILTLALVGAYTIGFMAAYHRLIGGRKELKEELRITVTYTLLALVMTYPLVFHYTTHVPGDNQDASKFMWNLWWAKESVTGLKNPFYCDRIFHPLGTSLVFDTYAFILGVLSIPVQATLGLITAYNTMILLAIVWSGLGTYKLVEHLTSRKDVALACGIAFAFTPYRMAHMLGHLNLVSTQWMPFYILHLFKSLDKGDRRDGILAGVFFAATAFTELTYAMMLGITTLIVVGHKAYHSRTALKSGRLVGNIKTLLLASILLTSPLIYMIASEYGSYARRDRYLVSVVHSADLLAFATPPSYHPVMGDTFRSIEARFTGYLAEKVVYVGWVILALSILSLFKAEKLAGKKLHDILDVTDSKSVWAILAIVFLLMSLGPVLHVYGIHLVKKEDGYSYLSDDNMPLPYSLIMELPLISMSRVPARYAIMLSLSVIVLAGYAMAGMIDKKKIDERALAVITALILFEYMAAPYPIVEMHYNMEYEHIASYPGDTVVYHIPSKMSPYYQTIHGRKTISGNVARLPDRVERMQAVIDFELRNLTARDFASKYGIDYFIIQRNHLENEKEVVGNFNRAFGNPSYMDDELAVFRTGV